MPHGSCGGCAGWMGQCLARRLPQLSEEIRATTVDTFEPRETPETSDDEAGGHRRIRVIAVAGPPAAGKSTLCDRIKQIYGLVHVSPGQILRDHIQRNTRLGAAIKRHVDDGQLVPSRLVIDIIKERLKRPDIRNRGCLLDNFPITAEQAEVLKGQIQVDQFIFLDVPSAVLIEHAIWRRIDPLTGSIYHLKSHPPAPEVLPRLVCRNDDMEHLVQKRLDCYNRHINAILPFFEGRIHRIDGTQAPDAVLSDVIERMSTLTWSTADRPYFGNVAFNGPFSAEDARRAGFFSALDPPEVGERVVCFRRGADLHRRGTVTGACARTSLGTGGLLKGEEGVEVESSTLKAGGPFVSWSSFLAPVNDMEYSSLCTSREFLFSNFASLYSATSGIDDVEAVPPEQARVSLERWLQNMRNADDEAIEVAPELRGKILDAFDAGAEASLYLYSTHQKLGRRTSRNSGQDYSVYYRALNNTLNSDHEGNLRHAMPLVKRMMYLLMYDEANGSRRQHGGGRVWKGDTQRPVPLNMHKLQEARRLGKLVRFRQFQSTTRREELADKYRRREDRPGYKWAIDIPAGFWGARDIHNISWKANEEETLFPAYSAFKVQSVSDGGCHLLAVDRSSELGARAERNGLRGSAVELLDY